MLPPRPPPVSFAPIAPASLATLTRKSSSRGMDLYEKMIPAGAAGMGGMEMFLNMKLPDIGYVAYSMTGYLVVCLGLSVWISRRRQLA